MNAIPGIDLRAGDCLDLLKTLPDNSVDSIVTDPPYGLTANKKGGSGAASVNLDNPYGRARIGTGNGAGGFMGHKWDSDVPSVEIWAECLRVLKPGGYLLAFAGTRTQHRMATRIEDAGFEIRDMIAWVYSSGFPKSHNLDNKRGKEICGCESSAKCDVRSVHRADVPQAQSVDQERGQILQSSLSQQGAPTAGWEKSSPSEIRGEESGLEGGRDLSQAPRELCFGSVCASPGVGDANGEGGRLRDGAQAGDGAVVRLPANTDGSGAPCGPQPDEQRAVELGALAGQPQSQTLGAWPVCGGCGLPVVPRGLGTALKPALEPITMARKPLIGTVAANVLAHGTGALNIDACRIETTENLNGGAYAKEGGRTESQSLHGGTGMNVAGKTVGKDFEQPTGRWPANLIHDGSDEVLAAFPQASGAVAPVRGTEPSAKTANAFGNFSGRAASDQRDGGGSAARFFYAAKASRRDRNEGLASSDEPVVAANATMREQEDADWSARNGNHHPTVKPTDLMRYLVRLVTQPGGTVLDPFMGSGSTGKACVLEGFQFIGFDLDPGYVGIAHARISHVVRQAEEQAADVQEKASQGDLFGGAHA